MGEGRRITSVSLRCTEAYFSVTNDHVLKIQNFSCSSQKIVLRTLIKRLTAILTFPPGASGKERSSCRRLETLSSLTL